MPKKILRILNRFNVGGPTYNVAYLTKHISNEYETLLIGGEKEESEASSEYMLSKIGVDYTIIPEMKRSINPFQDLKALFSIIKIIREYKPDIVHTHAAKAGTLGRLAAIICKTPVIIHTFHGHVFHSYFGSWKTKIFTSIEKWLAKKSTAIITISEAQKQELCYDFKICAPEKTEIVHLGFDLDRFNSNLEEKRNSFRTEYNLDNETIAIGIIGRLVPVKNHELFINAFAHCLQNTQNKIKAFIIGDGELRTELEQQVAALGISEKVVFTSWIKDVDVAYAGLDLVALTSKNEGTPVSLIEAQASGTPIVSTNIGGIKNIVIEGETALLSENNLVDFQEKLLLLIQDEKLRLEMSLQGASAIINKFGFKRLCTDMEKVYKKYLY